MATLTATQSSVSQAPAIVQRSARERYRQNVYFQDGIVLTGVLTGLLYLILATSLDAAGYVENMALLVPVTLGALALGFLMSFSRFDGFFALSHSMFTGLAWILYLMSGQVTPEEIAPFISNGIPEIQATAYFVLLRWLNWIDALINNVASNDNYIFIFEMCFLLWWLTYLGVWSIMRYGYTWRAIIPAGIVLLVNTYYAPQSILGFLVVFCLIAMLLFVRTNLAEQQLRWRDQRIHYSPDVTFDFLRNGLAYSVVIVALAWIVPGLGRNVQVRAVLDPINQQWEATSQRMNRLYQGLNRQTRPAASTFGDTLSLGGARNVGDSIVFHVSATRARYWRAVVYDTYTGRQWLSTEEDEANFDANEIVSAVPWALREPLTQTITLLAPSGGMIFAAPDILSVSLPIAAGMRELPVTDADGTPIYEVTSARTRRGLEANDSYVVVSAQTMITERALQEAGTEYPQGVLQAYLQLPENFSQRVADEAATVTANQTTAFGKARTLETFLRSIPYNDDIAAPPPDSDPVEYFLYDIREGYCDYYATAMVVMLRSLGIPARTVSGYAEGRYDEESRLYYVTERDAHTWVEVYFPGYGWIEFEPTAGETQLNRPTGNDLTGDPLFPEDLDPSAGSVFPQDPFEDEMMNPEGGALLPEDTTFLDDAAQLTTDNWWFWVVTPILLGAGLWFVYRTRINPPSGFDPELPPIFYERMQRWAERLGISGPLSHTPYEQAQHMSRALPEGRAPITSITEHYVRYRFSRRALPVSVHRTLVPPAPVSYAVSESAGGTLTQDWQLLQPLLWKNWLRKIFRLRRPTNGNHFALQKGKSPTD
jgi:transglutaminase-like putative cysteine protease